MTDVNQKMIGVNHYSGSGAFPNDDTCHLPRGKARPEAAETAPGTDGIAGRPPKKGCAARQGDVAEKTRIQRFSSAGNRLKIT
ncbi:MULTISPECIES: hypothetical protein [Pseudophaeobacter]|uniref:hypothetical protein n=1 Tax=Pseudophaeobacter TaxID=1541822 RepID=UPI00242E27EA|nr:hypothetical protein [Pseudophaeobacter profundi]